MICRVSMIILLQPDLEAAVAFYQQLGLGLRFHLQDKWAEFDIAGIKFGLCPTTVITEQAIHTGLVLEVQDLSAYYQKFQQSGFFVGEPVIKPHGIMLRVKDPGNNLVDLYQPTPDQLNDLVQKVSQKAQEGYPAQRPEDIQCCGKKNDTTCC